MQDETFGRLDGLAGVVTGAARGIGKGCAAELATRGARILLADLDEGSPQRRGRRSSRRAEQGSTGCVTDVRDWESVERMTGNLRPRVRRDRLRGRQRRDRRLQRSRHGRSGTVASGHRDEPPRRPAHRSRGVPEDEGTRRRPDRADGIDRRPADLGWRTRVHRHEVGRRRTGLGAPQGSARAQRAGHHDRTRHGRHAARPLRPRRVGASSIGSRRSQIDDVARAVVFALAQPRRRGGERADDHSGRSRAVRGDGWASPNGDRRPRAIGRRRDSVGLAADRIATPALVLDLPTATRNIAMMGERFRTLPAALRPHIKVAQVRGARVAAARPRGDRRDDGHGGRGGCDGCGWCPRHPDRERGRGPCLGRAHDRCRPPRETHRRGR